MKENRERTFNVIPMGCKVSQYEASALGLFLEKHLGLKRVDHPDEADVVVLHSCTVTAKADREARKIVRHHRRRGDVKIIVAGCYAERDPESLYEAGADFVIGHRTPHKAWQIKKFLTGVDDSDVITDDWATFGPPEISGNRTRAYLKIHDGCDVFCSFCIIPHVRGPGRSLPVERVIQNIITIRNKGIKEIVLTGVNIASYGRDAGMNDGFLKLCQAIAEIPGDFVVRISSFGAFDGDTTIFEFLCHHPRFAPHFHLPIQSGSPKVLKAMRRPYTLEQFDRVVRFIAEQNDEICLGTDVIVGFPVEGDREFEETLRYLEESPFAYFHVFSYSPRPGTLAASLYSSPDPGVIKARSQILRQLSGQKRRSFVEKQIGHTLRALTLTRKPDGSMRALTGNYIDITIPAVFKVEENAWIRIRLERSGQQWLGIPVDEHPPLVGKEPSSVTAVETSGYR